MCIVPSNLKLESPNHEHATRLIANLMLVDLEDAKAGIVRKTKKRTFFKHLFGFGYGDEGRIVSIPRGDGEAKDDVVR